MDLLHTIIAPPPIAARWMGHPAHLRGGSVWVDRRDDRRALTGAEAVQEHRTGI
jgi:hypothetical protein